MVNVQRDLIFDFGLHKGFDSEFYLRKGFRVVALEAVPELCAIAETKLAPYKDRLTIINKALFELPGETVSFYVVPNKDDWGSLFKGTAEKGIEKSVEIKVETIDLSSIFDQFGVPYYLKCDLEGGDKIFREQLLADDRRPTYVSVELNDGREGEFLGRAGYDQAQIVNQWMNPHKKPPNPPLEGEFVEAKFHGGTSGLFGLELDPARWIPTSEIDDLQKAWRLLKKRAPDLAPGWADVHVRSSRS